jgi:AraC family transcriptional regulator
MGESIKEYVLKRKLSEAAVELVTTNRRLIEIAIDYGFNSQEVFTRAFTKVFHITPGKYRKSNCRIVLYEKVNAYRKVLDNIGRMIKPAIVLEKEFHVVGLKKTVKPGDALIRSLWQEFSLRKSEINGIMNRESVLGICEYMPDITDESEFEYITGAEVTDYDYIPDGMISKTIPLSKYAVFTHRGNVEDMKTTYNMIYGMWLPVSGYELAEKDTIEIYSANGGDNWLNIYIPLKI